ncbi:unnamed protein product [Prorocentrum cordatum]|uniref:C962R-like N-terminal AEP domain-containing protein n=1 Tax=Prorocentrum cordatum TaxID=2364126 RepID=A0ABN9TTG1_9DINO|nr:unnamed protein product [Polarella glacialis]
MGHYELRMCDARLDGSTSDPEGCLNRWVLERATPGEVDGTHTVYFKVPAGLRCDECTPQWHWWSANSCQPAGDYGCYKDVLQSSGYWVGSKVIVSDCASLWLRFLADIGSRVCRRAMAGTLQATVLALASALRLQQASAHGELTVPASRNELGGSSTCARCLNGDGPCGDSSSLNFFAGSQATWTAGSIVPITVVVTAHHMGHYEFRICDARLDGSTSDPEGCLNRWVLERATPGEVTAAFGLGACAPGDDRPFCAPMDGRRPERWYLPPRGEVDGTHTVYFKVPAGLRCDECTLQWHWWSANSCQPAGDYGCYKDVLQSSGHWAGSKAPWWTAFGGSCSGPAGPNGHFGCGVRGHGRPCYLHVEAPRGAEPDTENRGADPQQRYGNRGLSKAWEGYQDQHQVGYVTPQAQRVHGLGADELAGAAPFPEVRQRFLSFIREQVQRCRQNAAGKSKACHVVLVGHNSWTFDDPMLMSGLVAEFGGAATEAAWFEAQIGEAVRVFSADSLRAAKRARQCGALAAPNDRLASVYAAVAHCPLENAHSALADARAVFTVVSALEAYMSSRRWTIGAAEAARLRAVRKLVRCPHFVSAVVAGLSETQDVNVAALKKRANDLPASSAAAAGEGASVIPAKQMSATEPFAYAKTRRARALSGRVIWDAADATDDANRESLPDILAAKTGVQPAFQTLVALGSDGEEWTLLVWLPALDPISLSFAMDFERNPLVGTWLSPLAALHISRDPLCGRLAHSELGPSESDGRRCPRNGMDMTSPGVPEPVAKQQGDNVKSQPRSSARSPLVAFLSKNNFLIRGKESSQQEITHALMDGAAGGRICLPDSAISAFFAAYGAELEAERPAFVIEGRTPVFKMHFDLDFTALHEDATAEAAAAIICSAVSSFIAKDDHADLGRTCWCIACGILDDAGARRAPGLHLVWPWLKVSTEQALWIRASALSMLRQGATCEQDWDKVLDIAVLTTNGLRMVGSDKCRDCRVCANGREARLFCGDCNRTGKIADNKIYWPWRAIPSHETEVLLRDLRENAAYVAHMCSIRVPSDQAVSCPAFRIPVGAPPPSLRKKLGRSQAASAEGRDHALQDATTQLGRAPGKREPLDLSEELKCALQECIATVDPSYANLEVRSADRRTNAERGRVTGCLLVKVSGFGCRFCLNKSAEHRQITVYFLVSTRGITQRCFSRKPVVHACGLCEKFSSPPAPLTRRLSTALIGAGCAFLIAQQPKREFLAIEAQPCGGRSSLGQSLKRQGDMLLLADRIWGKTRRTEDPPH